MYSIFADNICIFNDVTPLEELKIIDPKLTMEDSAAGSLELTLPPGNAGYNIIQRLTTNIIVKIDDEEIWEGRVLNESIDFWKRKKIYCEGELAYLNDTIQPQQLYSSDNTTISSFLNDIIAIHNSKVGVNRQFTVGMITINNGDEEGSDAINRYTDYESTLECINSKLVELLGGHIRVRHQNGVRYLDYISDDDMPLSSQVIQFGYNLLDYSTELSNDDFVTAIIPLGESQEEEVIEGLTNYLTVDGVIDPDTGEVQSGIYMFNNTAVSNYGWICTKVNWDDVTDKDILYSKGKKYLTDIQFEKLTLTIGMLDLHYMTDSAEPLRVLNRIRCISQPHGMDRIFPVSKMEINLLDPSNSTYTLGTNEKLSLTQTLNKVNNDILNKIENVPNKSTVLKTAKKSAFDILTGAIGGYVKFIKNENDILTAIEILDGIDDEHSTHKWVFNEGGLGNFIKENDEWVTVNVAMTMDGKIVADAITTGLLTISGSGTMFKAYNSQNQEVMSINQNGALIGGFTIGTDQLRFGDGMLSQYKIGCGSAGHGIVNLVGGPGRDDNYGYLQISNSGNPNTCLDGIRIYGNGKVVRYNGSGGESWVKWLSNIPDE